LQNMEEGTLNGNYDIETMIDKYSEYYLVCDVSYPLITSSSLFEESLIYNIENHKRVSLALDFFDITGKQLRQDSDISTLSGGQKVVLMVLLALYSPAQNICFYKLQHSLDADRLKAINSIIERFRVLKHEIKVLNYAVEYKA
jgi:hypothetical protein